MRLAWLGALTMTATLALSLPSSGCGLIGEAQPTPTPTATPTSTPTPSPTATPTATPTPTPTATPTPVPAVETASLQVHQGGAVALRVLASAGSAAATFAGRHYPMLPYPSGFWTIIGVTADQPLGTYPVSIELLDAASAPLGILSASLTVLDTEYPVEQIYLAPEQAALLDPALVQQEQNTRAAVFAAFTPQKLWTGPFIFPMSAPISSPYGVARSYDGGPATSYHTGTDFQADEGAPVMASATGTVAFVGALPLRGNGVIIDHGAGVFSAYHHLAQVTVALGQSVAAGDLVGTVGSTGLATGPHLHWEVIVMGVNVNPVLWTYEEMGP